MTARFACASALVAYGLAAGCVEPTVPRCEELVCPADKVCDPHRVLCVLPSQVAACATATDGTACTFPGESDGVCDHGVCFTSECGDGLVSSSEVCDDANSIDGDGCSAACLSDERCGNAIVDVALTESCDDGNLVSGDGCSSGCSAEVASWHELELDTWPGAWGAELAYDAARERAVMFGGTSPTGSPVGDVFELADGHWTRASRAPAAGTRAGHVMAYDATRRTVVVFGGENVMGLLGDTWAYDGAWHAIATSGPSPRSGAAGAYDAQRGTLVVFGGQTASGLVGETWELAGSTWTQRAVAGPSARRDHRMAYNAATGRIVLFGGRATAAGAHDLTDTWEWDGSAWTQVATATTAPAARGAMTYDASRGEVVLAGGWDTLSSAVWRFDEAARDWRELDAVAFPARRRPALTFDPAAGELVLRGGTTRAVGQGGPPYDDTWRRTTTGWVQDLAVEPHAPPPRNYFGFAYDTSRSRFVLAAGDSPGVSHRADTWTYDGEQWVELAATPAFAACGAPSCPAAMVAIPGTGTMILVRSAGMSPLETYRFDGRTWSRLATTGAPSPRQLFALTYDERRGVVVLFGGAAGPNLRGDTWELAGTTWTERMIPGPPSRSDTTLAYDSVRDVVVLFGGDALGTALDDTWLYDGTTWTQQVTPVRPSPRTGVGLVFHRARGRTILFGGDAQPNPNTDTWELDANGWSQITVFEGPVPRKAPRLAYDEARKLVVLFGGDPAEDTWELVFRSTLADEVCTAGGDEDLDGVAECADADCDAAPCADDRICRAGACACAHDEELRCDDRYDDDCDGLVDCADSACATAPTCVAAAACPTCELVESRCEDSLDNDGDGATDCADVNCYLRGCTEVTP